MTKLEDFTPCIREAWATWECLRRLGFIADDIFWIWQKTIRPNFKGLALNVVLKTQGREFVITCSRKLRRRDVPALMDEARVFQQQLAAGLFSQTQLHEILHASFAWKNQIDLLGSIRASGLVFPNVRPPEEELS